ncbi:hypothetical protein GCM10029964_053770 [Kibdelosporangium lantanae]
MVEHREIHNPMTTDVVSVHTDTLVDDVVQLPATRDVSAAPVMDTGDLLVNLRRDPKLVSSTWPHEGSATETSLVLRGRKRVTLAWPRQPGLTIASAPSRCSWVGARPAPRNVQRFAIGARRVDTGRRWARFSGS